MGCGISTRARILSTMAMAVLCGLATRAEAIAPAGAPAEANPGAVAAAKSANGNFAADLYRQLAQEQPNKNLFFSPSSVSTALTIALNGAAGETALQMGRVLRLPDSVRSKKADATEHPWNMPMVDSGQAALDTQFKPPEVPQAVRDRIAKLREDLAAANRQTRDLETKGPLRDAHKSAAAAQELADELNKLLAEVDLYKLHTATALWVEKTFPLRPSFLEATKTYFGGGAFPVDFRQNHEAARGEINGWAAKQTNDRVKDLIPRGTLTAQTQLVIASAIYFKGEWEKPFTESLTKDQDFLRAGGDKQKTPMMHQYGSEKYAAFRANGSLFNTPQTIPIKTSATDPSLYPDSHGFTMIELPYKGEKLFLTFIVPQSADGLSELEQRLTYKDLMKWVGVLQKRTVDLTIPKFKLEAEYNLNDSLQKLGMTRAFDSRLNDGAQFDDLAQSQDLAHKLYISDVVHKTFVEVNEKGTEAAAATAVTMDPVAAAPMAPEVTQPFIPIFRADKPFIFLIRDIQSGSILFLGRLMNPKS